MVRSGISGYLCSCAFAAAIVVVTKPAPAEQATWRGGDGRWSQAGRWDPNGVPRNTNGRLFTVFIDGGNEDDSLVDLDINATISNLNIDLRDKVRINAGRTLTIAADGFLTNAGRIDFLSSGRNATLTLQDGVTFNGGGVIALSGSATRIRGASGSSVFINQNNFIQGVGEISGGGMINRGVVFANSTGTLTLSPTSAGVLNEGTFAVNAGGTIDITGPNDSFLNYDRDANSLSGGIYQLRAGGAIALHDIVITNSATILLEGASTDNKTGLLAADGSDALLALRVNDVGGFVSAEGGRTFEIIARTGSIPSNGGTLRAGPGGTIRVRPNNALVPFVFANRTSAEGLILADGGRASVLADEIFGGTMRAINGGTLSVRSGLCHDTTIEIEAESRLNSIGTFACTINNAGTVDIGNTVLRADGSFRNDGTYWIHTGNATIELNVTGGDTTISGTGTILLDPIGSTKGVALSGLQPGDRLINNGNTITGGGLIYDLGLVNRGTIRADSYLEIAPNELGIQNDGTFYTTTNASLVLDAAPSNFSPATKTLTGGSYFCAGTIFFPGADIVTNAADITLDGDGGIFDSDLNYALINFAHNAAGAKFTVQRTEFVGPEAFSNAGLMHAKQGGRLTFVFSEIENRGSRRAGSGGIFRADAGGTIEFSTSLVHGGSVDIGAGGAAILDNTGLDATAVTNASGGNIFVRQFTSLSDATLTNSAGGRIKIEDGGTLLVFEQSTLTNSGTIELGSNGRSTSMWLTGGTIGNAGTFSLEGGGTVRLLANLNNEISGYYFGDTVVNQDNTIRGGGTVGDFATHFINRGTIIGDVPVFLQLRSEDSRFVNPGTIRADTGGRVHIDSLTLANHEAGVPGSIRASGGTVYIASSVIEGGTMDTIGGGTIDLSNSSLNADTIENVSGGTIRVLPFATSHIDSALTNAPAATLIVTDAGTLQIVGAGFLSNGGTTRLDATGNGGAMLRIAESDLTLVGGGSVLLSDSPGNRVTATNESLHLINVNNTIAGAGEISDMGIVNQGTIIARGANALRIVPTNAGGGFTNSGTLVVAAGGEAIITGPTGSFINYSAPAARIAGGTFHVSGTLRFDDAHVVNNAAAIILSGPSARIVDQNDSDALAEFTVNEAAGYFALRGGHHFASSGTFSNAGILDVGAACTLTVNGPQHYKQAAGVTTVDGTLTAEQGVFIHGGLLNGVGTIVGPVRVDGTGRFEPGHSPGRFAIDGTYEQDEAGAIQFQIDGYAAGDQFDVVTVSESVEFGGALEAAVAFDFHPVIGDRFTVMHFDFSSDLFDEERGMDLGNGLRLVAEYNPHDLTLVVIPEPSLGAVACAVAGLLAIRGLPRTARARAGAFAHFPTTTRRFSKRLALSVCNSRSRSWNRNVTNSGNNTRRAGEA